MVTLASHCVISRPRQYKCTHICAAVRDRSNLTDVRSNLGTHLAVTRNPWVMRRLTFGAFSADEQLDFRELIGLVTMYRNYVFESVYSPLVSRHCEALCQS
jgi:hypothetical protein